MNLIFNHLYWCNLHKATNYDKKKGGGGDLHMNNKMEGFDEFWTQKNSLLSTVTVFVISSYLLALLLLMNVVSIIRIRVIKESIINAIKLLYSLFKEKDLVLFCAFENVFH